MATVLETILGLYGISAVLIISKGLYGRYISPVSVYAVIWGTTLILFNSGAIEYPPLSNLTKFLLAGSFVAFILGAVTHAAFFPRQAHKERSPMIQCKVAQTLDQWSGVLRKVVLTSSILALVWASFQFLFVAASIGGIGALFSGLDLVRQGFLAGNVIYHIGAYIIPFAFVAAVLAGLLRAIDVRSRLAFTMAVIAVFAYGFSIGGRQIVLFFFLLYLNAYVLTRISMGVPIFERVYQSSSKVVLACFSLALIFGGIFLLRQQGLPTYIQDALSPPLLALYEFSPNAVGGLASIALYATSTYASFDDHLRQFSSGPMSYGYGISTVEYVYRLIRVVVGDLGVDVAGLHTRGFATDLWNTTPATYLHNLHLDFGIPGVILVPYFVGFLSSYWYDKCLQGDSVLWIAFNCYVLCFIEYSNQYSLLKESVAPNSFVYLVVLWLILTRAPRKFRGAGRYRSGLERTS